MKCTTSQNCNEVLYKCIPDAGVNDKETPQNDDAKSRDEFLSDGMNHNENQNRSSRESEAADAGRISKAHESSSAPDSPSMTTVTSKKADENIGLASVATPDEPSSKDEATKKAKKLKGDQPIGPSSKGSRDRQVQSADAASSRAG